MKQKSLQTKRALVELGGVGIRFSVHDLMVVTCFSYHLPFRW